MFLEAATEDCIYTRLIRATAIVAGLIQKQ